MSLDPVKSVVSINGLNFAQAKIRQPDDFGIEKYDLSKSGRLASGRMVMDIVAKKRKFTFAYKVISGREMDLLLSAIDTYTAFFPIVYIENGVEKSAIVYSGAKKAKKFRTDGVWYWKDFTFDLIEQ